MDREIILDRYKIDKFLGLSSCEEYFKCRDIKTNKDVLFRKIYINAFEASSRRHSTSYIEMLKSRLKDVFLDEVNLMKKNNFTGLPVFIDSVSNEHFYAIITEYRNGISLEEYLKEKSQLSESEVLSFLYKFLPIINYLHKQAPPIIYLYLEPSNIYIDSNNDVYLIKYSLISKYIELYRDMTRLGHPIMVSRGYVPPELFLLYESEESPKADIYSIGMIIFLILTGKSPLLPVLELPKISDIRKDVSPVWTQIVLRATHINKEERYESIDELIVDLKLIENNLY